jgi:hypothetical protein
MFRPRLVLLQTESKMSLVMEWPLAPRAVGKNSEASKPKCCIPAPVMCLAAQWRSSEWKRGIPGCNAFIARKLPITCKCEVNFNSLFVLNRQYFPWMWNPMGYIQISPHGCLVSYHMLLLLVSVQFYCGRMMCDITCRHRHSLAGKVIEVSMCV